MPEDQLPGGRVHRATRSLRLACYLDAPRRGGSSTALATLLTSLDERIEVTVVGSSSDVVEHVAAARPGTATRVLSAVRNKTDIGSMAEIVRTVRHLHPDVLHANLDSQWSAQYGLLAAVLTRTPVVAVVHSVWPRPHRFQRMLIKRLARRVDTYVGVSRYTARSTEALLGLTDGSVRVIYNGVPDPPERAVRSGDGLVVGAVGRLSPEKGYHVLLQAMRAVPDVRLVLLGDGPQRPELEELASHLGIAERVTFAGWIEPPWAARWAFDVLVLPSFSEGFGLVVVEAMLANVPVIATAVGAVPEIVADEETGLLVPSGDPDALAKAIERLLGDAGLRADYARRARAIASERFTTAKMAAEFETLYGELSAHRCQ
jgi:glycosyltransferase involved in cell wall biosynthesis